MGIIRGKHTSPGVYTKITSIRNKQIEHVAPNSTLNINTGGGDGESTLRFYYGYLPLKTNKGLLSDESISYLKSLDGEKIKDTPTILNYRTSQSTLLFNKGKDIIIKETISETELEEKIKSGEQFENIADDNNNCVVLLMPKKIYESGNYDIIDATFEKTLKDNFSKINDVKINGINYVFTAMFNAYWSYSSVGCDKVISPIILRLT